MWLKRPSLNNGFIYKHDEKYSGLSHIEKKEIIKKEILKNNCDSLFISEPENTCWFLNIRGNDLDFTPLVRGCLLYTSDAADE